MGATASNEKYGKKNKGTRGSVNNANRLEAFARGGGSSGGDWGGCDCKWIQAVVVAITSLGGAVTFGLSRDKGAHSVTLLLDDNRQTMWFNSNADLDDALSEVVATLEAMQ